eukprot:758215-Hanusia_phi.AAC.1
MEVRGAIESRRAAAGKKRSPCPLLGPTCPHSLPPPATHAPPKLPPPAPLPPLVLLITLSILLLLLLNPWSSLDPLYLQSKLSKCCLAAFGRIVEINLRRVKEERRKGKKSDGGKEWSEGGGEDEGREKGERQRRDGGEERRGGSEYRGAGRARMKSVPVGGQEDGSTSRVARVCPPLLTSSTSAPLLASKCGARALKEVRRKKTWVWRGSEGRGEERRREERRGEGRGEEEERRGEERREKMMTSWTRKLERKRTSLSGTGRFETDENDTEER